MDQEIYQERSSGAYGLDFQQIVEESPVAFYTCDTLGRITYFNRAASKLWGRKPLLKKESWCGAWKVTLPDGTVLDPEEGPMAKVLTTSTSQRTEVRMEQPEGESRSILMIADPLFDEEKEMNGGRCALVDITDEHKDHVKKATLSAIVESSDDAIISKDLGGVITSWNAGAERVFGYSEKEAIGQSIMMLIPEECHAEEVEIMAAIREGQRMNHLETVRVDKTGRRIPISVTISPIKDAHEKVVGASSVARDISERLKGEVKQARLSAIVESSEDAIVSKNLDGIIKSWNKGAEKVFGYTEEEVIGKSVTILIPEGRKDEEALILDKIRKGIKVEHFETIRRHKSGKMIPISLAVSPVKNSRGSIVGASKVARDITAQVKSKEAAEKHIRNLEILNSVGKSVAENLNVQEILQRVTDATTKLVGANFGAFFYNTKDEEGGSTRLFTLSGAPKEAFENFPMPRHTGIFAPTLVDRKVIRSADVTKEESFGNNPPYNGLPKGHLPVVSYLAVPVISKTGKVIGGLFFGHREADMFSEEHELLVVNIAAQAAVSLDNSELFQQVKSLSDKKDEFIALASHELKTPLTTIKGYLQVLSKREKNKMAERFLDKSLHQAEKLNTLVEDLLNMSRIESGRLNFNLEPFDIREMLQDIVETLGYSVENHVIKDDLGNKPGIIIGDKQRIEQVILNLVNNAIKYSPNADEVYVGLEVNDEHVKVRVRDKGIGMTPQQKEQLFTRFYRAETTKGINGLGLGLYLTKQIIDRHLGEIGVISSFGKGSEFFFTLPVDTLKRKSS